MAIVSTIIKSTIREGTIYPNQSEFTVKQHIDQNNDGVCGIYEPIDDTGAKLLA